MAATGQVRGIDHVNIDTDRPDETIAFYTTALGLENRPEDRPGGMTDGAWLFSGDRAVVHLNFHPSDSDTGRRIEARQRSAFNHVAFEGSDFDATCERLDEAGIEYRAVDRSEIRLKQIFIRDPNNIAIEINING